MPSNEGRGYVLRRIIRRAVRHGYQLGQEKPFFHGLADELARQMGDAYPELNEKLALIKDALLAEEKQFARTLEKGLAVLDAELKSLESSVIPGSVVFQLYDTYGFPVDLTNDLARERGLTLDIDGYESEMEQQRARARAAGQFKVDYTDALKLDAETEFCGYDALASNARVIALLKDGSEVEELAAGDTGVLVLDTTPFYGESGGQVGDTGRLFTEAADITVTNTTIAQHNNLHHVDVVKGQVRVGDEVTAEVNESIRKATARNHSATHLLHAALRKLLGEHVSQKGSHVDAERLRFDFSHNQAVSADELIAIEALVNEQIIANKRTSAQEMSMDEAKAAGAMALFGEKYGDEVRVMTMGTDGFSVELCGGTHVDRTGDIGLFKIVSEQGVASGVRRIEAITGIAAYQFALQFQTNMSLVADRLKTSTDSVVEKVVQVSEQLKASEKALAAANAKLAAASSADLVANAIEVKGVKVLAVHLPEADPKSLRELSDKLKDKLGSGVLLVAANSGDKISLIAGVTKDLTNSLKAGDLMKHVTGQLNGKGGGRPDMAQGGGEGLDKLPEALSSVASWVESQLG